MKTSKSAKIKAVAAIAIGAAVVLLLATEKGKKIRSAVADKAEDWGDDIKGKAEDWGDNISDFKDTAGDKMSSLKERLVEEAEGLMCDMRDRFMSILSEGESKGKKMVKMGRERLS